MHSTRGRPTSQICGNACLNIRLKKTMLGQISGWSILGRSIFMTVVVTGRPICVVLVLFMLGLGVCLHVTQCLVVDDHSELIMVITPARHLAYFGGGAPSSG